MFYTLVILSTLFFKLIATQGVGKVYIGNSPNISSSLSYNQNTPGASLLVPVYIVAQNPTDSSEVAIVGDVTVNCELSTSGAGFSSITSFVTVTLRDALRAGNVRFTGPVPGQRVDIRCFGQSISSLQFNKTESISAPSTFRIIKAPTVSIYPSGTKDIVDVYAQGVTQNFTVRLSEVVVGNAVQITCTGGAGLTFQTMTAQIGEIQVMVPVTMTTITPITGTCQGQSQGGGSQYQTANSRGPAVTFHVLQPSAILYPRNVETKTTSFSLILRMTSKPPASVISFRCRADLLATITQVQVVLQTPLCRNPAATTAPPAAGNGTNIIETIPNWGLLISNVTLSDGVNHARLIATRNLPSSIAVEENVVVSCCSTLGNPNLESTLWARVTLTPNVTVDWEKSTDANNFTTPRTIQNVAFVDLAPCPCDLDKGACDINCCCDNDCTAAQQQTFTGCIPYLAGGQTAATPEYKCDSNHFQKDDWFPLMCVTSEYNSLLGFFYQNDPVIRDTQTYISKSNSKNPFSYRETEQRVQPPYTTATIGYRQTEKVLSVKTTATGVAERRGVITLPQRILSGECAQSAPIQYLHDVNSDCSFQLTADMCSSSSVFNAMTYIQSSTTRDPSCPLTFSTMGNPTTQTVAETVVNYHCITDASSYIKSNARVPTPSTGSLFNYVYPAGCPADVCGREGDEAPPCTGYNDSPTQETLPPRCTFNDQYTRPPAPSINGGLCNNAVVDVRYNIYWSGPEIMKLNATVFLANISISSPASPVVVTQKYKAAFVHSYTGLPNNTQDNFYNVNTPFTRSGKPGYDIGKPVISGMEIRNATDNTFLYMNSNASRQMALWNTGYNGLCQTAGRREITFGQDTITSCNIYIGTADLQNCTDLSKLIINRLDNLMPADRIGRYGNNNPYGLTQWIPVLREDLTLTCTNRLEATNQTVLSWRFAGFCTNVVSGINLDILYGESGKSNGQPINEIIGANVSYTKSTWQLSCGSGSRCSNPSSVEPFPITASVRFIKVPANTPEPKIRWKEDNPDICFRDVCWENFLYPLERAYTAEPRQYVLAMCLVLILFFCGFLFITRPWW